MTPSAPKSPRLAEVAAGVTFILGFGAMLLLWLAGLGDSSRRGFIEYWSATVGDAIILPILAYALTKAALPIRDWSRRDRSLVIVAAGIAALGGVATQYTWLSSATIETNWTLPEPHVFNLPGWYHAVFLVVVSGFLAGACAASLLRLRSLDAAEWTRLLSSWRFVTALAGLPAFTVLLALDERSRDWGGIFVRGIAVLGLSIATIYGFRRSNVRELIFAGGTLILPLLSLAALSQLAGVTLSTTAYISVFIAASVGIGAVAALRHDSLGATAFACATTGVVAAGLSSAIVGRGVGGLLISLAVFAGSVAAIGQAIIIGARAREDFNLRAIVGTLLGEFSIATVLFIAIGLDVWSPDMVAQALLGSVAVIAMAPAHWRLARLLSTVKALEGSEASRLEQGSAKVASYVWACALLFAFILVLALMAVEAGFSLPSEHRSWHGLSPLPYLAFVALLLFHAAVNRAMAARRLKLRMLAIANSIVGTLGIVTVVRSYFLGSLRGPAAWAVIGGLMVCVGLGVFVYEGIISNMAYLQLREISSEVIFGGISAASVASASVAWPTFFLGSRDHGAGDLLSALGLLIAGAVLAVIVPWSTGLQLPGSRPEDSKVPASPLAGVLQDSFLGVVLAVSVGWLPVFYIVGVPDLSAALADVLIYGGVMYHSYTYIMKNNVEHATSFAASHPVGVDPGVHQRVASALFRHVMRQNRIALILPPMFISFVAAQVSPYESSEAVWLLGRGPGLKR
jgi:hypothetical protein